MKPTIEELKEALSKQIVMPDFTNQLLSDIGKMQRGIPFQQSDPDVSEEKLKYQRKKIVNV